MKRKILFHFWGVILLLLIFHLPLQGAEEDLLSAIKMIPIKGDQKTPYFSLKDLEGKKVELKQFKGKVIFLNFWATWCSPCKEEMPSLEVLHQKFKGKKFVLLAIAVDYGGIKPVKEFIHKYAYTFTVLIDSKGETLERFKVKGIPATFLIDKRGFMVGKAIGPRDWKSPEVISLINCLIEQ
ncbi:MAG: TlpA family protein disulfide reductase [Syntrophaceae bacterium]|nr:TlpA family protein disulfide reductase [Syntrophaceae bacterium]